ncbi:sugar kinase [Xanthobacteraceae bacterium Astr-EGSB]|uniref:sugar kinase n=1 Tax=Astrobacterium formosum TaxID=3069710 RepID=UPI0027AE3A87|nr:sugar kinase [Xanthobacteraceae bacterium Astr-EGSB]
MPSLVTFGETSAVFVARDIGRMRYCRDFTVRPGGAEATVAVGVKRLGFDTAWMSALGEDEMGHYIRSLVAGEGVDVSRVTMLPGKLTAVFLRERLPGGDARHFYYRKDSAFANYMPEMLDEGFIASAKFLHLTGINPALSPSCDAASWRAVEIAHAHGVKVSFDPNVRLALWSREQARACLERYLAAADVVFPGLEDMQMLYGPLADEDAITRLEQLGCRNIVMKCGEGDVLVATDGRIERLPVERIANPVDLMGAGDAFAAGALAGLLEGRDLVEAARLGVVVAGLAIQMPGNIEAMPTSDEVERRRSGGIAWKR